MMAILAAGALSATMAFGLAACDDNDSSEVEQLQSTIAQLQEELNKSNSELEAMEDLAAKLEALQQAFESASGNLDAINDEIAQLQSEVASLKEGTTITEKSYAKIKYIDEYLSDRDCYSGANFKDTQNWITELALAAGYDESAITTQDVTLSTYANKDNLDEALAAVKSYETDGKFYKRSGRNYVEDPDGEYVKVSVITENVIITKPGKSEKQIIVGSHFDGDGTGDNGSGVALNLTMLENLVSVKTPYTIQFVFFTAEEYGCYGSTAYANAMTDEEVENTLYMINLDSLVCGDYCYLYGGVQNNAAKTVTATEAYDNAMNIAKSLGLNFHSNPWTWDNPEPSSKTGIPAYASPSTGNWSDHKGFKNRGIKYLYMEATNWEIPDYSGYGETVLVGMLMNTENDYLEFIETYFPGRIQEHLYQFGTLLNALLVQPKVNF